MTSARLVDSIANLLPGRISRRGFFARAAVAGSALAVNPVTFALEPGTAYAAVCGCHGQSCACGSLCCDGYTEFCCTLTGRNTCPPGSLMAGWWKADGAQFCGGPRYYMDCNATCGGCGCGSTGTCGGGCSGTPCGCANGDCNNRAAGCNEFRYGNCHNEIPCLGPIVCRVVTCIPPWEIEPTCNAAAVRVDEFTAGHDRDCLHAVIGSFDVVTELNGAMRVIGYALDFDTQASVVVHVYVDGVGPIVGLADAYRPDMLAQFPGYRPNHGIDLLLPNGHTPRNICVFALNAAYSSANVLLGCRQYVPHEPFGALDAVTVGLGKIRAQGWVIDPDSAAAPINVRVTVGGTTVVAAATGSRPDVANFYPGFGPAHGFDVEIPISGGIYDVCATAVNTGAGSDAFLGCRTVEVGLPFGWIDVAHTVPGGVRLEGWVIDPDTLGAVQIQTVVDGVTSTFTANTSRPDVGAVFPFYGSAHGFDITLPLGPGRRDICLNAVNVGGGRNPTIGCRTLYVMADNPTGSLDRVTAGPDLVQVEGWVLDPDTTNTVDVAVLVDGVVATTVAATGTRADVAAQYPGWGAARGFSTTVAVPAGLHQIAARGVNQLDGTDVVVGSRSVMIGGAPLGAIDVVSARPDSVLVAGWAIDPDTAAPISVAISVDGGAPTTVTAGGARGDLPFFFPLYGPNHGFEAVVPVTPGVAHQIIVTARNVAAGGDVVLGIRNTQPPGGSPFGFLDVAAGVAGGINVAGWVIDPDVIGPVTLHVYVDGHPVLVDTATASRPDVGAGVPGYGAAHGFNLTVPTTPGHHFVCVYGLNQGVGGNSVIGCRDVTVPG